MERFPPIYSRFHPKVCFHFHPISFIPIFVGKKHTLLVETKKTFPQKPTAGSPENHPRNDDEKENHLNKKPPSILRVPAVSFWGCTHLLTSTNPSQAINPKSSGTLYVSEDRPLFTGKPLERTNHKVLSLFSDQFCYPPAACC